MSLNLSRVSAPRKGPPFPHDYEDRNKVPGAPNPGPFGPFLHLAQQSHSSHRPTRSHMIWLLPYWPALLAPGFTSGSHEGHPSILGTFQCVPTSDPLQGVRTHIAPQCDLTDKGKVFTELMGVK